MLTTNYPKGQIAKLYDFCLKAHNKFFLLVILIHLYGVGRSVILYVFPYTSYFVDCARLPPTILIASRILPTPHSPCLSRHTHARSFIQHQLNCLSISSPLRPLSNRTKHSMVIINLDYGAVNKLRSKTKIPILLWVFEVLSASPAATAL